MDTKKAIQLRTVFMGTSHLAESILNSLVECEYNIVGVYTKQDKKVGRKQELSESPVKKIAVKNSLPVFQPLRFNSETIEELKNLKPDLIIVAAYGKILPKEVLKIPGFGCINVHVSLLPKYRGPSPIQNALLNGEKETGVTIMLMDEGIDTGDILFQEKIKIDKDETSESLTGKLTELSSKTLLKTLPLWIERRISPQKQDHKKATLCQLIEREDGHIFWEDEAENIYNRYRALYPWPGIFTFWKNNGSLLRLKLIKISVQKTDVQNQKQIGEVFQLGEKIGVKTLKGIVFLQEIQLEGKKAVSIENFINGYPSFVGSILL